MKNFYGFSNERKYLLDNYKNKSLANSIILYGQKGIGKRTFLDNLIIDFLNLNQNIHNIDHQINLVYKHSHPNIRYIHKEYDDKLKKFKKNITINQIRNVFNFFYESTIDGASKFIIIDSTDDLNINASNSLLKILEEPTYNTFIFLISHNFSSLLPTLRSRCLKIKFKNHTYENFNKILNIKINNKNDEENKFLYDLSNGSPGIALKLVDDDISNIYNDIIFSLINSDQLSEIDINLSLRLSKLDEDKFKIVLSLFKFILINLNKCKVGINILDHYLSKNIENLMNASHKISVSSIYNLFEYLIKNENDLFAYNLDKKNFILNFLAQKEN